MVEVVVVARAEAVEVDQVISTIETMKDLRSERLGTARNSKQPTNSPISGLAGASLLGRLPGHGRARGLGLSVGEGRNKVLTLGGDEGSARATAESTSPPRFGSGPVGTPLPAAAGAPRADGEGRSRSEGEEGGAASREARQSAARAAATELGRSETGALGAAHGAHAAGRPLRRGGGAGGRDGGHKVGKGWLAPIGWSYRADLERLQDGRSGGSSPQGRRQSARRDAGSPGKTAGAVSGGGGARAAAGTRLGRALSQAAEIGLGGSGGARRRWRSAGMLAGARGDTGGGYVLGKHHRDSFPRKSNWRAKEPLELIHADVCGPNADTVVQQQLLFCSFRG
ncbi:uncharacterized protein LOC109713242 [Ananas comosus]|uniref:Uncharacterized protein LOC109713242 n=1 Tax=Ananas comosus TaxID=4615 RepID=A0A6P5FI14_ANACO|nr:uncharacterized protein LOC109713242 [Ananas comosus]